MMNAIEAMSGPRNEVCRQANSTRRIALAADENGRFADGGRRPAVDPSTSGPLLGHAQVSGNLVTRIRQFAAAAERQANGVLQGIYHYNARSRERIRFIPHQANWPILGALPSYLLSTNFDQFINHALARHDQENDGETNHRPFTLDVAGQTLLVVGHEQNHREIQLADKLTKRPLPGSRDGALGAVGHLIGSRTLVGLDVVDLPEDGGPAVKNKDFSALSKVVETGLMNARFMNRYLTQVPALIARHLDGATSAGGGHDLADLLFMMTSDIEGGYLGFTSYPPSEFFGAHPETEAFFKSAFVRLGEPIMNVSMAQRERALAQATRHMQVFGLEMMSRNFDTFLSVAKRENDWLPRTLVAVWEHYFEQPFPGDRDEFSALMQAPERADALDAFTRMLFTLQVVAGEYTTHVADFGLRQLMNRPEVLARIRDELDQAALSPAALNLSTTERTPYLFAFVLEVLRCHPPVRISVGMAREDYGVRLDGRDTQISKGTLVVFDNQRINRTLDLSGTGTPAGAGFNPDNFMEAMTRDGGAKAFLSALKRSPEHLRSFGGVFGGMPSRVCPGKDFAVSELAQIFATIASTFEMIPGGGLPVSLDEHMPSTLQPSEPIQVSFTRR